MKAYKGFNKDMTCRGFQYEEGKTYVTDEADLCNSGFHACENPLDCFSYYEPGQSVFHKVELDDVSDQTSEDSKRAGKRITIGAELSVAEICKLHFEYTKSHTTFKHTDEKIASAGDHGSASAGDRGCASAGEWGNASAGEYGSASAGNRGSASAGEWGSASAGDCGSASAGEYGSASAGCKGSASAGDCGSAVSRGSVKVGKNGCALVRGHDVKACGGIGAALTICEEKEESYEIECCKTIVIDGDKYKPDVWYCIKNGEVVEA